MKPLQKVHIIYLFPREMNTYGDRGNVLCLQKRLEWRGIKVEVIEFHPGDRVPKHSDLIFMGGGQDSGQRIVEQSMLQLAGWLKDQVEADTPALMICGAYQLLGRYFETHEGNHIQGVDIFDAHTVAGDKRLIGNVRVQTEQFGELIGFENHSGKTYLGPTAQALGRTRRGSGNNGSDRTEGIVHRNFVGTYLHGPILPKNPQLADWLISRAANMSHTELAQFEDSFVVQARAIAARRPR
ncbi:glutamine amidotransferase [bacterium]|nr:glutamine amidotransferase [bacterium]